MYIYIYIKFYHIYRGMRAHDPFFTPCPSGTIPANAFLAPDAVVRCPSVAVLAFQWQAIPSKVRQKKALQFGATGRVAICSNAYSTASIVFTTEDGK
jgi:hypothetical protein